MTGKSLLKRYNGVGLISVVLIILLGVLTMYSYFEWPPNFLLGSADSYAELLRADDVNHNKASNTLDRPFLISAISVPFSSISSLNLIMGFKIIYFFMFILSIILLFKIIKERKMKVIMFLLIVITPYIIFMQFEVERAPVIVFFFLFALNFYLKYLEKNEYAYFIFSSIFIGFSIFTHMTSYFFVLSFLIIIFLLSKEKGKDSIFFLIICGASFLIVFLTKYLFGGDIVSETTLVAFSGFMINLLNGFDKIGLWRFVESFKNHLSPLVYYTALGGLLITLIKFKKTPHHVKIFFVWFVVLFFSFSIQYESFSHSSRYPFYLVVPLIFFSVYFLTSVFKRVNRKITILIMFFFITSLVSTLYLQDLSFYRNRWEPHTKVCEYLVTNSRINEYNQILYLGWPSVTFECEKGGIEQYFMHTFGWNRTNLESIDKEFIKSNNIKYYIYDNTGSDYYDSSNIVFYKLDKMYKLKKIEEFNSYKSPHFKVELYEILGEKNGI